MDLIKPGDHGSTYGGNPLGMAVSRVAIQTLIEEGMIENSEKMGTLFLELLKEIKNPLIKDVRGKGLFAAIELKQKDKIKVDANDLAYILQKNGMLCKSTHDHTIRFAPPLIIDKDSIARAAMKVRRSLT